ncbi:UNVERIFIED_CONTAM: cytochrome, partial [Sesamum angustifolium]
EMLAAATSTTCAAIEWLMAELVKNQGVLHKLRHEIESMVDGDIKNASLCHMPYLQACLKEALRVSWRGFFLIGFIQGISPDDLDMTEKFETTVYMKEPLSLIPRSRNNVIVIMNCFVSNYGSKSRYL